MAGDRDTLIARVSCACNAAIDQRPIADPYKAIADDLLAAGYRPPAQVIETVEQLEALPIGAIVLECETLDGEAHQPVWRQINYVGTKRAWEEPGLRDPMLSSAVKLPALLLWCPTEKAGQ
ncbi:hypothetical protein [Nocardia brasiliensis]|uniref:hypothetical protein n=1 Tax=Nocardia brasiliensis TaxID=37326 RepID=UPI00245475D7|nr:hypothetical protein [Nocardia brasiliensis]